MYTPSNLGPVALGLWVYISGKPLLPMLQLYNIRTYTYVVNLHETIVCIHIHDYYN